MLSESELAAWYRQRNLSERAQQLVNRIRSSEPARRVRWWAVQCERVLPQPENGPPFPNDRGVTADYHYAVEQALRYRRPKAKIGFGR